MFIKFQIFIYCDVSLLRAADRSTAKEIIQLK